MTGSIIISRMHTQIINVLLRQSGVEQHEFIQFRTGVIPITSGVRTSNDHSTVCRGATNSSFSDICCRKPSILVSLDSSALFQIHKVEDHMGPNYWYILQINIQRTILQVQRKAEIQLESDLKCWEMDSCTISVMNQLCV